ncbi:DUF4345 domain-containing protein [Sphingomonas sp. Leaf4]|uniref:DUF4345 domain-containing protein n=1 Tax=Sphingomonas sp. Leaf4 TaxID=2876553 RepID=UPI001E334524|nr:DUF4345 domain-containing protein [Sphingomonas sp. Leaf4]
MSPRCERTLLQAVVALTCLLPLVAGSLGMVRGATWVQSAPTVDLDSHFRYLSGLLVGIAAGFLSCIPGIERKSGRIRLLGAIVILGGLGRLAGLGEMGLPSIGHRIGLGVELVVVPLVLAWQTRIMHRCHRP